MTESPNRPHEVLVLEGRHGSMQPLAEGLRASGVQVDITHDLAGVRDAFFRRGGHDLIVLGPDLPARTARIAAQTLSRIDDSIQVITFGDRAQQGLPETRVTAFHPGSRAAVGAVLRLLLPLPSGRA